MPNAETTNRPRTPTAGGTASIREIEGDAGPRTRKQKTVRHAQTIRDMEEPRPSKRTIRPRPDDDGQARDKRKSVGKSAPVRPRGRLGGVDTPTRSREYECKVGMELGRTDQGRLGVFGVLRYAMRITSANPVGPTTRRKQPD